MSEVENVLGPPLRISTNHRSEPGYEYPNLSARFSSADMKLIEVGFYPTADLFVNEVEVFKDGFAFNKLIGDDGEPFEFVGFVILLRLGLTMTGFHDSDESQKAVTVFEKGRWDHLRNRMRSFTQKESE